MKKLLKGLLVSFLLSAVIWALPNTAAAAKAITDQDRDGLHLISASEDGVTFEVGLSLDQINQAIIERGEKKYLGLTIPGWDRITLEGAPALPIRVVTIGVPFDAKLDVWVTPGNKINMELSHPILPVAAQVVDWENWQNLQLPTPQYEMIENQPIYTTDQAFPRDLAEITADGVIRDQRVIGVAVYPLQYIPATRDLIIYENLTVTIKFTGSTLSQNRSISPQNNSFDKLFQTMLFNYETAVQWRQEPASLLSRSGDRALPWSPPDPGWRVLVREEGFYQLGYDELHTAGLPVDTLDPQTLQLFNQGREVAVLVEGEGDGNFDIGDHLIFFGQAVKSKYTAENVYWLTYGKSQTGLRMASRDAAPGTAETPQAYLANQRIEENTNYISLAPGDETLERWLGEYIYARDSKPASLSYEFNLENHYPSTAKLTIQLLGFLRHSINPDHHVKIYLENALGRFYLGEVWWDGLSWEKVQMAIEPEWLFKGQNTILVECPNDTGLGVDVVYFDWLKLDYSNRFVAVGDQLAFSFQEPGAWNFQINGFTTDDVWVFDVSNPKAVERLTGISLTPLVTNYSLGFEDLISEPKKYWAITTENIMHVVGIEPDKPSNLYAPSNLADHLIITHSAFAVQAEKLRSFRESHDFAAVRVDIQDVYDEFNFGITESTAIREFLSYTITNWKIFPAYVVLFGDGHYDPKGYLGFGGESYIPPYLAAVDSHLGETSADNRYVTLIGEDNLPDMKLGRLAVNTPEEADAVVDKIMAYETVPPLGDWRQQILAVTDDPDQAGSFYSISDGLVACCLPGPFKVDKVYFKNTHLTVEEARAAVQAGINSGKLIVNYIGHGSTSQWGEELLKTSDIDNLNNGVLMPIMLPMTCMDGYFISSAGNHQAFAERITRVAGKGAIASWSPTGWGTVIGHDSLNKGFFEAVFQIGDGSMTIGRATQAGKIALFSTGANYDLLDTFLLFGDPATKIPFNFTAVDDSYTIEEDASLKVSAQGILENDIHPENADLAAILDEDPQNGNLELTSDGTFTYLPDPNFFGVDSFTYYAFDGEEYSNVAVVEITVTAVNEKIFLPLIH